MCLNSHWLQMSLCSLCLLSVRSLVILIFPCIPQTSLHVSIPHPRHHYLWSGTLLPFLLGYFFIVGRVCINDVAQKCHITAPCLRPLSFTPSLSSWLFLHSWKVLHQWCRSTVSHNCIVSETSFFLWKYCHIILHLGLFLELSSLVLHNNSHPSFFVGNCTRSFIQVKYISCMVRNIS